MCGIQHVSSRMLRSAEWGKTMLHGKRFSPVINGNYSTHILTFVSLATLNARAISHIIKSFVMAGMSQLGPAASVCSTCQRTLFSTSSFRIAWEAQYHADTQGFHYKCKWEQVQEGAGSGCPWCRILLGRLSSDLEERAYAPANLAEEAFDIGVKFSKLWENLYMELEVDNIVQLWAVHTDPGMIIPPNHWLICLRAYGMDNRQYCGELYP